MATPSPLPLRSLRAILARLEVLPLDQPVGPAIATWCRCAEVEGVLESTPVGEAHRAVLAKTLPELEATFGGLNLPQQPRGLEVTILPTYIWLERDLFGGYDVVMQHEGLKPFVFASLFYDWRYTDNASIHAQAVALAVSLGAQEPVEVRRQVPSVFEEVLAVPSAN